MANRYWVGGTGTWDASSTANWAATSGGAAGASAPVAADTVFFDSLSGTGICTTASGVTCAIATLNTATVTLKLGASLTLSGAFTLTLGAFDLNNQTFTCQVFSSSNTNTRSVAFGTGKIVITGNATTVLAMLTVTGFSYTGTSRVEFNYSGSTGTRTCNFGNTAGHTEANVLNMYVTAGSDIFSTGGGFRVRTYDFTGFSGTLNNNSVSCFGDLVISSGMTVNAGINGITFAATSGTQQITTNGKTLDFPITQNSPGATLQLQDNLTMGSTRTFTLTAGTLDLVSRTLSTGLFNSSNSNVRSIAFGTGNITTTGVGSVWGTSTNANFSYTGTPTVNISNNSATATTVSTGAMTESQALNFNYTTGTYTLTDTAATYRSVNFTGFTGTILNSVRTIYGSFTLVAGMTLTAGANATTFASTTAGNTITSAGKTQDYPIIFNGIGGAWTCQDALTLGSTRALTITNGTLNLRSGVVSTVGSFVTTGTNQKYLGASTPGAQATITDASGVNSVSYLTIQDSDAAGGAVWQAFYGNGNIDAGNNTDWDFGETPVLGTEYEYKLRSFTQPRRL